TSHAVGNPGVPAEAPSFEAYGGPAPANYQRYFVPAIGAPLAATLVETAGLRAGERVLDVACGTGVVTRLAAQQVGPTGDVTGVDLNPGMLAVAREATPPGMPIAWHEASAETLGLPGDTYDVVLCQMGLQFFADKEGALREMRRVLKPGGRLVLNLPGPTPRAFAVMADALARHVAPATAGFVHAVFSLHDPEAVRDLLAAAGFRDVRTHVAARTLRLAPPAEFLWQYVWSTPLAPQLDGAGSKRRAAVERDVVAEWSKMTDGGALQIDVNMLTAVAGR
ncbi:MAG TPA: methyltransferase domain-containing protein, partial [Vicinamibacterales bacterium]